MLLTAFLNWDTFIVQQIIHLTSILPAIRMLLGSKHHLQVIKEHFTEVGCLFIENARKVSMVDYFRELNEAQSSSSVDLA